MESTEISRRSVALIAFLGVVLTLIGVGVAAGGGAPPDLATGDLAATVRGILDAGDGFRVGMVGWLLVIFGDVVRAWALYVFFRPVNRGVAMLAAWWMLLHDALLGVGTAALLVLSTGLAGAGPFAGMALGAADPLAALLLGTFDLAFNVGLFFFSFHLLLNGWLVLKSVDVPRVLGWLLVLAWAGYLVDAGSAVLLTDPPALISQVVALPNTVGELALVVWLAFRGGRAKPA